MKWFSEHKLGLVIVLLLIVLFISIGITSQGRTKTTFVEGAISKTISPMQKVLFSSSQYINKFYNSILNLSNLQNRNKELEEDLYKSKLKIADYDRISRENEELKSLINFTKENPKYEYIPASIISIDPYVGFSIFIADKGSMNGVEKDMTVVLNDGLVGRVIEVSLGTSKVLAISDKASMFNGECVRTGDYVRVTGSDNYSLIGYIDFEASIVPGDMVVTSGLGGIFPKNIIIGEVVQINEQEGMLERLINIKPIVNFKKMSKVLIIK